MWLSLLTALQSVPKILAVLERLSDIATVQLAQQRKTKKDADIEVILAAAAARREQRLLDGEVERVQRDSGEE
jgi:hypothetical protein